MKRRHPAYAMLLREAKRLGLPKHYKDDLLVHDRRFLGENDHKTCFAWGIRECGTHCVMCVCNDAEDYVPMIEQSFYGTIWYFWDGHELIYCRDLDEIINRIRGAIRRLPEFGIRFRGGELHVHAANVEIAKKYLLRKLQRNYWWLVGTQSPVFAM